MLNWVLNSPNDPAASYIFIRTLLHEFVHHEHAKSGSAKNRTREQEENITRLETAFFFGDSIYTSYNGVLGPSGTVRPAPNQKFFNDKNELIAYEDTKNVVFSVFLVKDASGKVQFFKSPDGIEMPAIYLNAYPDQLPERLINQAKIKELEKILETHQSEKIIIFTVHTKLAYNISNRFLIPVITNKTKNEERNEILEKFRKSHYRVIVTTKVLDEGTDVPDANMGVILSGTGSKREFIQRLGRLLRPKQETENLANLIEIISSDTSEVFTSSKRNKAIRKVHGG